LGFEDAKDVASMFAFFLLVQGDSPKKKKNPLT
jgi:hypothetical protein